MFFDSVKGNLGFGCMRLKMIDDKVDYQEFSRMMDTFIAAGFNYFDTAHIYLGGESEKALKTLRFVNQILPTSLLNGPLFPSADCLKVKTKSYPALLTDYRKG